MTSKSLICLEESIQSNLPPRLVLNPRKIILPEEISVEELEDKEKDNNVYNSQLIPYPTKPPPGPVPKFSLQIAWWPNTLCFVLDEKQITNRVWIWNCSKRAIYFNCCGLWDDTARCGASWCSYPRTRIWLSPGLRAEIFVQARPREISPIPFATTYMQIAAGHMRDNVTGYFSIPIKVKFIKYLPPPTPEME